MKVKQVLGITLFSLVLGFGFISCSDDDDNETPQIPAVVGTWKFESTKAIVKVTDPEIEQSVIEYIENLENDDVDAYVFKIDNKFTAKLAGEDGQEISGVYQFEDDNIYFLDEKNLPLKFADNKLSKIQDVKSKVIEALELTEEQLTEAKEQRLYQRITK